jgi:hypothetical protein
MKNIKETNREIQISQNKFVSLSRYGSRIIQGDPVKEERFSGLLIC